jgi:hypothetical protein
MTIIVEDGTIVTGANSYVSEAELTAYATARGLTLSTDGEQLLIRGMDYIEAQSYKGTKFTKDQPLQWPRAGVYVDDYLVDADEIPTELKNGLMESALAIDNGQDPLADIARTTKSETVGSLSVTYADNASSTTIVRKISSSLRKLLGGGSGGSQFNVGRG